MSKKVKLVLENGHEFKLRFEKNDNGSIDVMTDDDGGLPIYLVQFRTDGTLSRYEYINEMTDKFKTTTVNGKIKLSKE